MQTVKVKKKARETITFRVSPKIKAMMVESARKQNLDPSDVFRLTLTAGLKELYGVNVLGNEIVWFMALFSANEQHLKIGLST